jgi:MFS family permease
MSEAKPRSLTVGGVCIAGPALVSLVPMAAAPAMPSMAARFAEGGDGQLFAQLVMTAPAIMLILAAPLAGVLAARFGRRPTLLVSLALFVIGGAGVLFVEHRAPLIAMRLLLGVAGGGLLTASLALIGEHFEDRARERVLGFATSLASLVAAMALTFGGSLVDHGGWRAPFGLYLLGIPVMAVAWIVIRPGASPVKIGVAEDRRSFAPLMPMAPYYLMLMLLTVGMFTPAIQVPFLLEDRGITSAQVQGTIIAVTSIVAMMSAAAYGLLRRWIGVHGMLAIDALCMGAGILTIALSDGLAGTIVGCALVGIGAGMSEPATASLIFDRTPPWVHALAMGLIVSALNVGQFVNPLVMAPLRAAFDVNGSFVVLGAILLCAGLYVVVVRRDDLVERRLHGRERVIV